MDLVMCFGAESLSLAMTNKHYSASLVWSDKDDAYVATCPEFPGLSVVEPDMMLALSVLHDAVLIELHFKEAGAELPEPARFERCHSLLEG
jgi:hypothetical protein